MEAVVKLELQLEAEVLLIEDRLVSRCVRRGRIDPQNWTFMENIGA